MSLQEETQVNCSVDIDLLQADLDGLAKITDPENPWTRRSFSPLFLKGRDFLKAAFEKEGLEVSLDAAGNLIGRWQGSEKGDRVLMSGSHSDTVPSGGRFDGIAGILAGLAAVRSLKQAGYQPRHSIEVVDFLAEEPSEWGLSCVGSRGMVGALGEAEMSLIGPQDERLDAAIARIGGKPQELKAPLRDDIDGYVEIHIEQGPVLEAREIPIGIVTSIAGIARVRVRFDGTAAHAGTAPMNMRQDAALAMSRFILAVNSAAVDAQGRGHFTATVGLLHVEPGGANVVPGAAEVVVDIRSENDEVMGEYIERLASLADEAASSEHCTLGHFELLSRTVAVPCDQDLRKEISKAADTLGFPTMTLASGAGHDAAFVARIARSAMIFVPSHEGKSHRPDEWTETPDIAKAAELLAQTLVRLDQA